MLMYKMTNEQTTGFFASLLKDHKMVGPVRRHDQNGFVKFGPIFAANELVLDYITTTIPPKNAFFPPVQPLFSLREKQQYQPLTINDEPFILVGVHPCDLAAIEQLDVVYGEAPADEPWLTARKRATIIGVDCKPDEYCFCPSVETLTSRKPCDLFLTKLPDGYLVETHSGKGVALIEGTEKELAEESDFSNAFKWVTDKKNQVTAKIEGSAVKLASVLKKGGLGPVWKEVADRCYSCGSCNTTCPTCFCFDVTDELDLSMERGVRKRTWDSCQLLDFAAVAGGHNFREERWQRVKHRWHRKFLYLYERHGVPYCTGCGRCSRACTVDINIVDVSNQLIAYANERGGHGR